ncbi:MAG: hypothetical protein IPN71_12670 [Fibrobacteres bacterium]|nr:hypothetical protein [Fibrobacterota bacterium]
MKPLFHFCLLPALAFASKGATVPVPKDSQGRSPAITRSMVTKDGTWIVADTAHRIWWSRDVGAHWDSVASSPNGSPAEMFGETVWNSAESHAWTSDAGWRTIDYPAACGAGRSNSISSGGVIGLIDSARANVSFCRSNDGLRTWVYWMSIPVSTLPVGVKDLTGDHWNNKIWYPVADSAYVRGTSDGRSWSRIDLPPRMKTFEFVPLTSNGSELVLFGGESGREMVHVAVSTDLGNTWDVHSASEPGWLVRKMSGNLFSTMTFDTLQGRGYGISRSRSGPWTMLDTAFRGNLVQGDDPYVVEEHAIYKLVLDGVGRRFKPAASEWSVRREQGILAVSLPSALQASAWTVRAIDGRKLASGRVTGERIELSLAMAGGLLTVGDQTRMLPGF